MDDGALNVAFLAFHTTWILFNAVGWIFPRTRPWHLTTVGLTALSWLGLGAWYGWGYCVCTDWHWRVRERLGYRNDPDSYMQLLISDVFRIDVGPFWADALTGGTFALVAVLSIVLNVKDASARSASSTPL